MTATKFIALFAGALLATAASAGGDKDMKTADQKFTQLDTNQDRSISKSEASSDSNLSATFASIDADGDGELSKTEFTSHLTERKGMGERDQSRDWSAPDQE